jgi:hypothetical protein
MAHGDYVPGKITNEEDVPCTEKVGPDESIKVRSREGVHFAPCTVKVGGNGVLLVAFVLCDEDVAKRCGAGGRGDSEDNVRCWGQLLGGVAGGLPAKSGF